MHEKTPEVKEKIRRVAKERGLQKQWKALSEQLNRRRIRTVTGLKWKPLNLELFCTAHALFEDAPLSNTNEAESLTPDAKLGRPTQLAARDGAAPVIQEQFHVTHRDTPPRQFDDNTINEFMQMLEWWKARKDQLLLSAASVQERPVFNRGADTITKTIRIGKELFKDAEKLAKKERALTGGTFSGLVELLLWKHLGCNDKYLRKEE